MIFFVGNDGTVINSFPSPVYQGAVNANTIYLVAPFAANLQVTVAFKLPNGVWTERYLMTQVNEIAGVVNKDTGKPYVGWQFSMPNEITQYYGTVTAQFFFYSGQGKVLTASSATSFTVGRGVPEILPAEPSADIYNQILDNLSILSQDIKNLSLFLGVFVSVEALKDAYPSAVLHSYAYIAGGNIWTYEESGWTDSGKPSPNEVPPLSDSIPLMDGEGSAGNSVEVSRADHVHPTDASRASAEDLDKMQADVNKNLYNLGAFDTEVSNGDGTKTITRQTGYLVINAENLSGTPHANQGRGIYVMLTSLALPLDADTSIFELGKSNIGKPVTNLSEYWLLANSIGFSGANNIAISATTEAVDKDYFVNLCPIHIQYKLASFYTEQVIEEQPIHTLDQLGEHWIRTEWLKGLNKYNGPERIAIQSNNEIWKSQIFGNYTVKPNTVYTFSCSTANTGVDGCYIKIRDANTNATIIEDPHTTKTFITPNGCTSIQIELYASRGTALTNIQTYTDIMINESDHPYPYESYYGGIVRQSEVPIYFSTVNTSPAATIGGDWTSLGSFTIGSTIVYAWRRV
ncbi:MAG: hypothetical protein [Caudoviricetes sp.]|nr:MAG: hypothetical protein [Caudoviricetes sp.]